MELQTEYEEYYDFVVQHLSHYAIGTLLTVHLIHGRGLLQIAYLLSRLRL